MSPIHATAVTSALMMVGFTLTARQPEWRTVGMVVNKRVASGIATENTPIANGVVPRSDNRDQNALVTNRPKCPYQGMVSTLHHDWASLRVPSRKAATLRWSLAGSVTSPDSDRCRAPRPSFPSPATAATRRRRRAGRRRHRGNPTGLQRPVHARHRRDDESGYR